MRLEWGVGMRLRGEFQHDFNVKQYGQSTRDGILLERLRVELGLRLSGGLRLYLQGQDAHELGCDFADQSFPNGSPYNNRFDLGQGYVEWDRIGLHYAYGSGDSDTHDNTDRTFDGIFGAVDKYYGRMNLFAWANLHDLQLAVSASPSGPMQITVDHHLFLLANEHDAWYYANGKPQRRDPSGASGVLVGQEVDLVGVIRVKRHTQFQVGYGLFVPGAFVRNTGPHGLAHGGFLQWSSNF